MSLDFTPSMRKHGAQRMLSSTTLMCEALVVFFGILAAHGLEPESRGTNWIIGLSISAILALLPGAMRGPQAWPYWVGLVMQLAVIGYGFVVPAMFFVGLAFAVIYVVGLVKGHDIDREKDEIDRKYHSMNRRRGK